MIRAGRGTRLQVVTRERWSLPIDYLQFVLPVGRCVSHGRFALMSYPSIVFCHLTGMTGSLSHQVTTLLSRVWQHGPFPRIRAMGATCSVRPCSSQRRSGECASHAVGMHSH